MPSFKRPRVYKPKYKKYAKKKYTKKYAKRYARKTFAKKVMSVVNRKSEVKEFLYATATNAPVYHNQVKNLSNNVFGIPIGFNGLAINGTPGVRVGNKIFVKSISLAVNLESQQYRPLVSYWLYLVRRRGASVAQSVSINDKEAMFEGASTTIPCDYIDKEKVEVLWCKKLTLRMPNMGSLVNMSTQSAVGAGVLDEASGTAWTYDVEDYKIVTNPQYQGKFFIPINKMITYMDVQDVQNTPNYLPQLVIAAYDNYTTITGDDKAPCGHITMTFKVRFTDV